MTFSLYSPFAENTWRSFRTAKAETRANIAAVMPVEYQSFVDFGDKPRVWGIPNNTHTEKFHMESSLANEMPIHAAYRMLALIQGTDMNIEMFVVKMKNFKCSIRINTILAWTTKHSHGVPRTFVRPQIHIEHQYRALQQSFGVRKMVQ